MASISLPSIISLLKPHPISTKPNLQKVCHESNIEYETSETRQQWTGKIAYFAEESLSNEANIRKILSDLSAELRKNKIQAASGLPESSDDTMELDDTQNQLQPLQPTTVPNHDSQTPLFDDTQDSSEVVTEITTGTAATTKLRLLLKKQSLV